MLLWIRLRGISAVSGEATLSKIFFFLSKNFALKERNMYPWMHNFYFFLTQLCLAPHKRDIGKQCSPDQTPQNAASDQGLHCLH